MCDINELHVSVVSSGFSARRARKQQLTQTFAMLSMWPTSAPTPGVPTTSYRLSASTRSFIFSSSDSGCPIPPDAPAQNLMSAVSECTRMMICWTHRLTETVTGIPYG